MATNIQSRLERQAEIDIGYDYEFERKWDRFERGVWLVYGLLLLGGILGVFGRGPLNKVKRTLPDGTIVQYSRVVRFKSPSAVTFTLPVHDGAATIQASNGVVEKLGLQSLFPNPTQNLGSSQVGPFRFQAASPGAENVFIQMTMQPSGIGPVTSTYYINGLTSVSIKQFIVP
jgi:hypothetical protein